MFKSMKRIIKWAGKYKGRLYLGSVFSFFSSLSTAIPTMAAAYALAWCGEGKQNFHPIIFLLLHYNHLPSF